LYQNRTFFINRIFAAEFLRLQLVETKDSDTALLRCSKDTFQPFEADAARSKHKHLLTLGTAANAPYDAICVGRT
jgi:hypothetical protein